MMVVVVSVVGAVVGVGGNKPCVFLPIPRHVNHARRQRQAAGRAREWSAAHWQAKAEGKEDSLCLSLPCCVHAYHSIAQLRVGLVGNRLGAGQVATQVFAQSGRLAAHS